MKRVLSVLLALCLVIGAVPVFAFAADEDFVIEDGVLTKYNGPGGDVVVPDGVTSIGRSVFAGRKDITGVKLPDGLISIGIMSFEGSGLTSIDMPDSVTIIKDSSFASCRKLTDVKLSNNLKTIEGYAFQYCESITTIKLPNSMTRIRTDAFTLCKNLASIEIPKSITEIEAFAFVGSNNLRDVYYAGTKSEWEKISKGSNEQLDNATIHFNSGSPDPSTGFTDVRANAYYADAVKWAVENNITAGTGGGKFSPDKTCTRDQIVTFLYRSKNSPAVTITSQFTDMPKNQEFQKAISWAVENSITVGDGKGHFLPAKGCTRAEAMTFIWRAAGKPEPQAVAGFTDMPSNSDFQKAISWASENGITSGVGGNRFGSNRTCTRGQIVTFLYNARSIF